MEIFINDKSVTIEAQCSIQQMLDQYYDQQKGIAIAIDHHVVPKDQWRDHFLKPEDKVIIIKATQGG